MKVNDKKIVQELISREEIFEITVESKWEDVNKYLSSNSLWKHSD